MPTMQEALDIFDALAPDEREYLKSQFIGASRLESLRTILEEIRNCPALYLGKASLIRLESFVHGYLTAFDDLQVTHGSEKLFPLPYWLFDSYVSSRYPSHGCEAGWSTIILKECREDDEKSFCTFYTLYDEFAALKAKSCCKVHLNKNNIAFHTANGRAPHRIISSKKLNKTEPLYKNPVEVYLIELTNNAGFLCFIRESNRNVLENRIFLHEQEAMQFSEACFGKLQGWEEAKENVFDVPTKWDTICTP